MNQPAQPAGRAPQVTASPFITGNEGAPPSTTQRHAVVFTGSGSEYFRIWIVNLLLIMVTLGLYYPWAKVRKLKYFYNNTEVAGHALDFHGDPKRMLRGFLLMAVLLAAYSAAGRKSQLAGGVAGLIMMLIWPALIRSSLQFRLANTSWRGLRFHFAGSMGGIYLVFALPMLAFVGLTAVGTGLISQIGGGMASGLVAVVMILGLYALMPYVYYRLKAYQHANYALAGWQTEWRATFGDVLRVFMKTGGVAFLVMLLGGVAAVALLIGGGMATFGAAGGPSAKAIVALLPLLILLVIALTIVPMPYFQSRMQNLAWSQTGNRDLRFKSHLGFGALLRQTALNWVLMILTLGLYWPFAAVAMTRLKLQAISVHLRKDPDLLVAQARQAYREGAGDAAADLAGIDVGL